MTTSILAFASLFSNSDFDIAAALTTALLSVISGVFWAVTSGRLVPKSTVDKLIAGKDSEISLLKEISEQDRAALVAYAKPLQLATKAVGELQKHVEVSL